MNNFCITFLFNLCIFFSLHKINIIARHHSSISSAHTRHAVICEYLSVFIHPMFLCQVRPYQSSFLFFADVSLEEPELVYVCDQLSVTCPISKLWNMFGTRFLTSRSSFQFICVMEETPITHPRGLEELKWWSDTSSCANSSLNHQEFISTANKLFCKTFQFMVSYCRNAFSSLHSKYVSRHISKLSRINTNWIWKRTSSSCRG